MAGREGTTGGTTGRATGGGILIEGAWGVAEGAMGAVVATGPTGTTLAGTVGAAGAGMDGGAGGAGGAMAGRRLDACCTDDGGCCAEGAGMEGMDGIPPAGGIITGYGIPGTIIIG